MSEKIRTQHLERKAILYVRQSSPYQVIHNLESQKLQYAMQERLRHLGWHEIEVVDEVRLAKLSSERRRNLRFELTGRFATAAGRVG
jgi:DNA invertase Pin-like site-specific DNA recombinase